MSSCRLLTINFIEMYKEEQEFLKTIKEIKDKESPLVFTKLEVLILLKNYKEQLLIQRVSNNEVAVCDFCNDPQGEIKSICHSCHSELVKP